MDNIEVTLSHVAQSKLGQLLAAGYVVNGFALVVPKEHEKRATLDYLGRVEYLGGKVLTAPGAGSGADSRAQFEAWSRSKFGGIDLGRHENGEYLYERRRDDWEVWQAARQPVIVAEQEAAGDWQDDYAAMEAAWPTDAPSTQPVGQGPVAVVGGGFTLFWAGDCPIEPLVKRHGIKVGSKLYAHPPETPTSSEPVAARFDFDGYGWSYIDNGSGSDWATRKKDAELLYTHPPAPAAMPVDAKSIWWLSDAIGILSASGNTFHAEELQKLRDMLATHPPAGSGGR